jgi:hypothetical protein
MGIKIIFCGQGWKLVGMQRAGASQLSVSNVSLPRPCKSIGASRSSETISTPFTPRSVDEQSKLLQTLHDIQQPEV